MLVGQPRQLVDIERDVCLLRTNDVRGKTIRATCCQHNGPSPSRLISPGVRVCGSPDDGRVFCTGGRCRGHNERANILRAGEDLVRHVLPSTGPEGLEPQVRSILAAYRGDNSWDSGRILEETEALVRQSR
ncbi:unnamed protein product [Nezara viridula]|uniref:Uncharacterized protein n=1 Tax=Nezara viridula TaxID=85310 RepID=A0A9P0HRM3_NEZVI|nr:unnamed protein product [Nezara viridula]